MLARCRAAVRAARCALPSSSRAAGGPPQRDARFAALTDADLAHFRNILGATSVITGAWGCSGTPTGCVNADALESLSSRRRVRAGGVQR